MKLNLHRIVRLSIAIPEPAAGLPIKPLKPTHMMMPSNNKGWGFYGTIKRADQDDIWKAFNSMGLTDIADDLAKMSPEKRADAVWDITMNYLVNLGFLGSEREARDYLDSKHGRHLADIILGGDPRFALGRYLERDIKGWRKTYDPASYE